VTGLKTGCRCQRNFFVYTSWNDRLRRVTNMKLFSQILTFILVLASLPVDAGSNAEPRQVYDWLTRLEGPWTLSPAERQEGKAAEHPTVSPLLGGEKVAMNYRLVGRGSTVQEDLLPDNERQMVTMYHCADASCSAVKATHYCAKRNQPEFLASMESTSEKLVFECDMSTDLCQSWDDHIHRITLELSDNGTHLKTVYSSYMNGEYSKDTIYHFDRK